MHALFATFALTALPPQAAAFRQDVKAFLKEHLPEVPADVRAGWGRVLAEIPTCTPPGSQTLVIVPTIPSNNACQWGAETELGKDR